MKLFWFSHVFRIVLYKVILIFTCTNSFILKLILRPTLPTYAILFIRWPTIRHWLLHVFGYCASFLCFHQRFSLPTDLLSFTDFNFWTINLLFIFMKLFYTLLLQALLIIYPYLHDEHTMCGVHWDLYRL